ncbi:hypothetical protein [Arthrobacter sp. 92]|uniref:hypothetical protein n=1 Tax=Arthrobacter sp. 92 TaxID=3418175 RepID=UPI003D013D91
MGTHRLTRARTLQRLAVTAAALLGIAAVAWSGLFGAAAPGPSAEQETTTATADHSHGAADPPAASPSPGGAKPAAAGPSPGGAQPVQRTSDPWALQPGATERILAAGMPILTDEGTGEHYHAHLDVYLDGKAITVPAWIGFTDGAPGQLAGVSPAHTHDATGIIHIESEKPGQRYLLTQVLQEWGVLAGAGSIGGHPAGEWTVYVNGVQQAAPVGQVVLRGWDEIALTHGDTPSPLPSSYAFPPNL